MYISYSVDQVVLSQARLTDSLLGALPLETDGLRTALYVAREVIVQQEKIDVLREDRSRRYRAVKHF